MRYAGLANDRVSVVGLGCWQFGAPEWGWGEEGGEKTARAIVEKALELGVNVFDTAEIYGDGRSEEILAAALGSQRERAFVATKVSPVHATRSGVVAAAGRSLRRLRTDRVDLYQVHWPNRLVPLAWTMAGMRDLVDAGTVRHVGVSNFSLRAWRRAEAALGAPVATNQVHFNLLHLAPLADLVPFARENGRLVIAYSPLAQGALGGAYDESRRPSDFRADRPLFSAGNLRRMKPLLSELEEVAKSHQATPSQVALAWLVGQEGVISIPGARTVAQIEENAAAADLKLSDDEWQRLHDVAARTELDLPRRPLRALVNRVLGW